MSITRGTTPQIVFTCNVPPQDFKICHIAFSQSNKLLFIKTLKDCSISENDLILTLSELDTLKFVSTRDVEIQLRVEYSDGSKDASNIIKTTVEKILEDGILNEDSSTVSKN